MIAATTASTAFATTAWSIITAAAAAGADAASVPDRLAGEAVIGKLVDRFYKVATW